MEIKVPTLLGSQMDLSFFHSEYPDATSNKSALTLEENFQIEKIKCCKCCKTTKEKIHHKFRDLIPPDNDKNLVHDQLLDKSEDDHPRFKNLFIAILLTFWCGCLCQLVALTFALLGHNAVLNGKYGRARSYRKYAYVCLLVGVVGLAALVYPLQKKYTPVYMEEDFTKERLVLPCDPGCFYRAARKDCFC